MPLSPPERPPTAIALSHLAAATDRLLATIDAMSAADFAAPSTLPGWSRAHVLAHLALNAKGLAGVLTTLGQPHPLTMYASAARRDSDIDELAAQAPAHIADRVAVGSAVLAQHLGAGPTPEDALEAVGAAGSAVGAAGSAAGGTGSAAGGTGSAVGGTGQASAAVLADAANESAHATSVGASTAGRAAAPPRPQRDAGVFAAALDPAALAAWSVDGTFDRVPGGPVMTAAEIPFMRWREVEIHHADLGLGYGPNNWPAEFTSYLFATAAYDRDGITLMTLTATDGPRFALTATPEVGESAGWPVARALPEISGSMADLAWWLIGRGTGEGLTVTGANELPALGPWTRR